ncbi:MAG: PDZ domain-containing protein [Dysgonamonadaceae bacterium]|jgi:carboxyl-terminal processing protease|nr:PDZ domain-containing protein [Dysgonamonadaceae bacterium]
MKLKEGFWWIIVGIFAALIVGFFAGNFLSGKSFGRKLFLNPENKIDAILNIIEEEYVDQVDMTTLTDNAILKVIGELDPHSRYIPAGDLGKINEDMEGHFAGIGIESFVHADTLVIVGMAQGSPAQQAGLMRGDRIVTVNDTAFVGKSFSFDKILNALRGEIGTVVKIGIMRNGANVIRNYHVKRNHIPITTVKASYQVANGIGLIKIFDKFSHTTYDEFIKAIAELLNSGCRSFIIDLRMNGGGSFDAAVKICNEFLPAGSSIVYTKGKSFHREDAIANGLGTLQNNQVVILMDQVSASASEIVAGAIQDNDRGLIVGRRSFGKGLVQNQIELSDGSAFRLTIARYYTPSGRNIQRRYTMGHADEYNQDWLDRFSNGEEFDENSAVADSGMLYHTLNGREVYGGGGIMPDVFVPLDTSELTSYYIHLESKNIFYRFACEYADMNRSRLSEFKNYQSMWEYLKQQPLLDEIIDFAAALKVKPRTSLINTSANYILTTTYAYILQTFFGEEAFFIVYMDRDRDIAKAVEMLQKGLAYPEAVRGMKYK